MLLLLLLEEGEIEEGEVFLRVNRGVNRGRIMKEEARGRGGHQKKQGEETLSMLLRRRLAVVRESSSNKTH